MKKSLFTAVAAITLASSFAQNLFLEKTCYRGAFAPAPTAMWTDGWAEWDPQNKVYPAPTVTVNANITTNTTWTAGQTYLLQGPIYVTGNSILTIPAGVVVKGQSGAGGSGLFITKGSKLIAVGTATSPIVFTSDQPIGSRAPGDWGGIILMGKGAINSPNGINNIEGIAASSLTEYGGGTSPDDNDNSGDLQYVRIEFGGYIYAPDKEINGLTIGGVGRGTTIDHVQCSFTNDDSFEWFGGAVNCKHLIAYRGVDDDFDTDFGFRGTVQFCLGVRDPNLADPTYANTSGASTSEGFESDNDGSGSTATPQTGAIFSNVTDIGPLRGVLTATCHPGFRRGARIRRNSALKIVNSILMDHKTRGVYIDGALSEGNATSGSLVFKNNILAGYGQRATEVGSGSTFNANSWVAANANDTLLSSLNILANPYSWTAPDFRPTAGSIALSNASFTDAAIAAATKPYTSTVVATIPQVVCIGNGVTVIPANFVASTTLEPIYCSLSWSVSPGVTISSSTAINPSFTISTVGTFSVYLIVADANGNQTSMTSITTNTCSDVSVKEIANRIGAVSLYPNPTKDAATLLVNTQNAASLNVNVYDITGKLVLSPVQNTTLNTGENKFALDTQNLQNGIYFVTLTSSKGKETVKLVVNK
ncbi:T9SS type A sorting domain-containing protein [Aurantibacillus circumpalustris]|uniref:T9SS type A sorting domain-containing protein n=1 Tax=Aurantibacillus circumpalustris TaxID=3036359 RepID=UPI00295BB5EF|nr:T9SS type A sorting domain-containing protein [Aurantibacillus circumpalustris]